MGSGSRVVLCKTSSSLNLFAPAAFTASHLSFKSFLLSSPATNSRLHHNHRMATEASSSASSVNDGDNVIPSLANDAAPSSSSSAIDFLSLCHSLKKTKRAGWIKRDVKNPESIADHMYRMGLMALIAPDIPGIDRDKCVKMAIVHDIAEAKEISQLWMEYEENSSPEAKIVKDFDKVEMILQALEYENEQDRDLDEFFQSTAGKFQTEVGKAWALEIASRRKKSH
ncbi:5'-deoxynucleotidase HDDC2 isoform X2 [Ricinus communis]|uniref:5'-deoxynucleotidase HDDC2 isoform X2 n=1 Tax=Ricinus communis TaxID=3988 RepID=UPI00201AA251|nr:5'-deoxynucleotidase HDDC2 isoform X2 [Ricinus communis]